MTPDALLDMNLDTLECYLLGREQAQVDQLLLAVQTGYWAGYYSNAKKPKPLEYFLRKIEKGRYGHQTCTDVPDIEKFKQREANVGK